MKELRTSFMAAGARERGTLEVVVKKYDNRDATKGR